jgi:SAM-dependent methyltransferase
MSKIYQDGRYLAQNPTWGEEDSPVKAKWIKKILEQNTVTPAAITDVGCGSGQVIVELSRHYPECKFFGYEISRDAFTICSKKAAENITFLNRDFVSDDHTTEVLLIIDVFEHVDDYIGFLRSIKDKARFKIFHIPLDISVQTVFRASPIRRVREKVGHLHYFTKETALATLGYAGYDINDYFYTAGSIEVPSSFRQRIMRVPRMACFSIHRDLTVRVLGGYSLLVLCQ